MKKGRSLLVVRRRLRGLDRVLDDGKAEKDRDGVRDGRVSDMTRYAIV